MLNTKDAGGFLKPLAPHAQALYTAAIPGEENALSAACIAGAARAFGIEAEETVSIAAALRAVVGRAEAINTNRPARVLICGSVSTSPE